jgi:hypothetical protein
METKIKATKRELNAFLKYFYYVEGIAQESGYDTASHWTGNAVAFHDRMLKAKHELEDEERVKA